MRHERGPLLHRPQAQSNESKAPLQTEGWIKWASFPVRVGPPSSMEIEQTALAAAQHKQDVTFTQCMPSVGIVASLVRGVLQCAATASPRPYPERSHFPRSRVPTVSRDRRSLYLVHTLTEYGGRRRDSQQPFISFQWEDGKSPRKRNSALEIHFCVWIWWKATKSIGKW